MHALPQRRPHAPNFGHFYFTTGSVATNRPSHRGRELALSARDPISSRHEDEVVLGNFSPVHVRLVVVPPLASLQGLGPVHHHVALHVEKTRAHGLGDAVNLAQREARGILVELHDQAAQGRRRPSREHLERSAPSEPHARRAVCRKRGQIEVRRLFRQGEGAAPQ